MDALGTLFLLCVGTLIYFSLAGDREDPAPEPDAHDEPMGEASSYRRERK
mgnify:CR=1 FL=1